MKKLLIIMFIASFIFFGFAILVHPTLLTVAISSLLLGFNLCLILVVIVGEKIQSKQLQVIEKLEEDLRIQACEGK